MISVDPADLSKLLGEDVHDIVREPSIDGGHSRIFSCKTKTNNLVIRICAGQQGYYTQYFPHLMDWDRWMDQRWATASARTVGVPAPEIVFADRARRWVIMKRLPGIPIDSEYERWNDCPYDEQEFGILLGRMHSITPAGWGPIDDAGHALFACWPEFLLAAARSAIATCAERAAISETLCHHLEQTWLPALAKIHLDTPSLLHMESLGFANIMYAPETRKITGLLDYEDCMGGDPRFEFVWMRFYFEHDGAQQPYFNFQRFTQGYGKINWEDPVMQLYRPFTYLDKLRWIPIPSERATRYNRLLDAIAESGNSNY